MAVVPEQDSNKFIYPARLGHLEQDVEQDCFVGSVVRQRILIADDYPNSRLFLIEVLQSFGFELQEAVNGRDAIARWQQWHPHLILMDLRMPILNGLEAIRHIKETEAGKQTVIIALTASLSSQDRKELQRIGCDDYLCKPFTYQELIAKLNHHLGVNLVV